MQIPGDCDFFFFKFFEQDKFQDKLQGKFQERSHHKQTPPSNSLKLIEFET
jgi:hypothetical protein